MEEAITYLKKNGWHVSLDKVKKQLLKDESPDAEKRFLREPERWMVDEDIKHVTVPSLPDGINSGKVTQISTPLVLQVKKVEIISAPKQNVESEAAPRMLKVTLSDGKSICHGVEFEHIKKLSLATPPGTKICLIGTVKMWNGLIILDSKNLHFLGGEVPDLIEDWKVQQLLLGHVRAQDRDGPPPWVPFGYKIQPLNIIDGKDKKTLEEKENVVKDEEFLNQRQDAIAAAANASGVTKVIKGSGRQLEMQETDRRGRGRERRERNSNRDEERFAKPRDSIRLFEFLQPQIVGEPQKEEVDDNVDDYAELEDRPTWERDSGYRRHPGRGRGEPYRRGRGSYSEDTSYNQGRGGSQRGRGGSDDSYRDRRGSHRGRGSHYDDSFRDRRESHRGRGSHQDQDWRGVRPSFRGSSDQEQSYTSRESTRGYQDRRGSSRGSRRGSYRDIEDSHSTYNRNYTTSRSPVDALVDDFNAWPGLDTKPKTQPATQVEIRAPKVAQQDQWAVEDFCFAKWESSDKHYPAVVQQLHPARKSATVMFVESGAIRIVETKYLRRDPLDDEDNRPSFSSRGGSSGRVYTPRNRGLRGGL